MQRLFIADLHLQPRSDNLDPQLNSLQRIVDHNQSLIKKIDEIYFLGDIFEYWLGIDHGQIHYQDELSTLKQLTQQKKCFFIRGNRDVLFSQEDAQALNLTLLDDPCILSLNPNANKKILLTHGDAWTTRKLDQLYRRLSLSGFLQQNIRRLSTKKRIKLATFLRKRSRGNHQQDHTSQPNPQTIDQEVKPIEQLNQHANFDYFANSGNYEAIICGHFHRPGIYQTSHTTIYQLGNLRHSQGNISVYALLFNQDQYQFTLLTSI